MRFPTVSFFMSESGRQTEKFWFFAVLLKKDMYNTEEMWYNHTVLLYKGVLCAFIKLYRLAAVYGREIQ